jgi:DNA-binding NtrC family response regulator
LIPLLDKFLAIFSKDLHKDVHGISPEAIDVLTNYSWPGNVRELQNVLKQTLLRSAGPVIIPDFLPDKVRNPEQQTPAESRDGSSTDLRRFVDDHLNDDATNLYADALEFMERYVVTRVLRTCDGNQSQAARILGITRGCLRSKVRALNISIDAQVRIDGEKVAVGV